MLKGHVVKVVIPALNEADSIAAVITALPSWVDEVIVVDNNSADQTATAAARAGAKVVVEQRRGYGSACYTGVRHAVGADILLFIDGDLSDYPEEAGLLVGPIADGQADFVLGSRNHGRASRGSLSLPQRFGNRFACSLMRFLWRTCYTDLGPFRAIRRSTLEQLHMEDRDYGWTIEMQIKAARIGCRVLEVPVSYRERRTGQSKVSGSIRGVVGASVKILFTIARYAVTRR